MDRLDKDIDWGYWFDQWELMQNGYIPHRLYRFNLIYELAGLMDMDKPRILDLGCGPHSLSFRALEVNLLARPGRSCDRR